MQHIHYNLIKARVFKKDRLLIADLDFGDKV